MCFLNVLWFLKQTCSEFRAGRTDFEGAGIGAKKKVFINETGLNKKNMGSLGIKKGGKLGNNGLYGTTSVTELGITTQGSTYIPD